MADTEPQVAAPKPRVQSGKAASYADLEKQAAKQAEEAAKKETTKEKAAKPEKIAPKRMGFDAFRPFRLAKGFVFGTVGNTLQGISKGGRIGIYTGIAAGVLGIIGMGVGAAPMMLFALPVMAALGGIAIGGSIGLLTGGIQGVRREERREKYADDLAQKQETKRPTSSDRHLHRAAIRDYRDEQKYVSGVNFDRMQQQLREDAKDDRMYWSDHVGNGSGNGRGF